MGQGAGDGTQRPFFRILPCRVLSFSSVNRVASGPTTILDAGAAAAEPIQALEVEAKRHDQCDERQDVDVLLDRRMAARDGDEAGLAVARRNNRVVAYHKTSEVPES